MARTIATDAGDYIVFHAFEAGIPEAFGLQDAWYFQPADYADGPFSEGYQSPEAAEAAALEWVASEANEWAAQELETDRFIETLRIQYAAAHGADAADAATEEAMEEEYWEGEKKQSAYEARHPEMGF